MKKIFVICVAGLLTFVFTSVTFALDEENDIAKRHEKRMEKLMLSARSQAVNAEVKRANPTDSTKNKKDGTFTLIYDAGRFGGERKIEGEYTKKGNELWIEREGKWCIAEGFKNIEDYLSSIYNEHHRPLEWYLIAIILNGEVFFTAEIILNGEKFLPAEKIEGTVEDGIKGMEFVPEPTVTFATTRDEIIQRKAVEAQIELKGDGKNYTISGQMANAPKEDILVQKKQ